MVTTISALVGLALVAAPSKPLPFDDAFAGVTSPKDVHTAVMKATVVVFYQDISELAPPATGFFVWKRGSDGRQRVFLVTAAHTFKGAKPHMTLQVWSRHKTSRGQCESERWELEMYDRPGNPLWLRDSGADVAVLEVGRDRVPCVAISVSDLATTAGVGSFGLGDEVFTVGYPASLASSSSADGYYAFLRSGRVSGYPGATANYSETGIYFDVAVSGGYSGAPVYWFMGSGEGSSPGTVRPRVMVVGVVTGVLHKPNSKDGGSIDLGVGYAALAAYARALIEKAK